MQMTEFGLERVRKDRVRDWPRSAEREGERGKKKERKKEPRELTRVALAEKDPSRAFSCEQSQ